MWFSGSHPGFGSVQAQSESPRRGWDRCSIGARQGSQEEKEATSLRKQNPSICNHKRMVLSVLVTLDIGLVRRIGGQRDGGKGKVKGSREAFCKVTSEDPSLQVGS